MIHSTAIIDTQAQVAAGVEIGPYSVIGAGVSIETDTKIGSHVVIEGPCKIGEQNSIHSFACIGGAPQDKKYAGEMTKLEIGRGNTIREYCTINRGTEGGGGTTRLGNGNWMMAYVHLAHDCQVGNNNIMANGTSLAGHAEVGSFVIFGGFTLVHQFCLIGDHSFMSGGSVLVQDVPPFVTVAGDRAVPRGLNKEGLRRYGYSPQVINTLHKAYKIIYRSGLQLSSAIVELDKLADQHSDADDIFSPVNKLCNFLKSSSRGIVR